MKTLLVIAVLLCSTTLAFCQASWTYRVGFVLNDRSGQQIHDYEITSGKCRVFTRKDFPGQVLNYTSALGIFYMTGSATYPGISIGLINGSDSTAVVLPVVSERVILTNWPTIPGIYVLNVDYETRRINNPEAILTQFHSGDKSLFSLTVLDWSKYRVDPKNQDWNWKDYFIKDRIVKVQTHE